MRLKMAKGGSPSPFSGAADAKRVYATALISGFLYIPWASYAANPAWAVKNSQHAVLVAMYAQFGFDVVTTVPVAGYL
jgi:hypothetical protein